MGRARHPMKLYFTGSHCYGLVDAHLKTEKQVLLKIADSPSMRWLIHRAELCELT